MSRLFAGGTDEMRFAPEGITLDGAFTMALLIDLTVANGGWQAILAGHSNASTGQNAVGRTNNNHFSGFNQSYTQDSNATTSFTILAADGWEILVAKRSSATGGVTFSKSVIGSGTWTHSVNVGASVAGSSISSGHIRIGNWQTSDPFEGYLAVAAIWDGTALSQGDVESLDNSSATSDWYDLTPDWLVDDSDSFATNLMTDTARTSITGTADDANDPSGWTYGIGGEEPITDAAEKLRIVRSNLRFV